MIWVWWVKIFPYFLRLKMKAKAKPAMNPPMCAMQAIPPVSDGEVNPNGEVLPVTCEDYRDVPLDEPFEIQPSILLEKAVAPAYFEFGNLVNGAWIDSWEKDGRVSISGADICYFAGDPIWILLYNGTEGPMTFNLECRNAPLERTVSTSSSLKLSDSRSP